MNFKVHRKIAEQWSEENIVQRLDYLLYCSRIKGHELIETYTNEMEKSLTQRALVESELLDALGSNQIVPYFQPFIDMNTNQVVGLEILARWEHPKQGFQKRWLRGWVRYDTQSPHPRGRCLPHSCRGRRETGMENRIKKQ